MKDMELEHAVCEPGLEEWALWKVLSRGSCSGQKWGSL